MMVVNGSPQGAKCPKNVEYVMRVYIMSSDQCCGRVPAIWALGPIG